MQDRPWTWKVPDTSAVLGLGGSSTEERINCPRAGAALNYDLIGYPLGTVNGCPPAQCLINESHLGYAAYGACGIGENVGDYRLRNMQCAGQVGYGLSHDSRQRSQTAWQDMIVCAPWASYQRQTRPV
jgi:hypothetical protein